MNHPTDNNQKSDHTPQRQTNSTPPIEWPVKASADNARAAAIARQHVERVYSRAETEQPRSTQQTTPQHESHHQMRNEPYNWDEYHNAWQQYYHQYFYRYYAGWWQQQKRQLEAEASTRTHQSEKNTEASSNQQEKIAKELRSKVRTTVQSRAHKLKKSSHFKPVMAAITVGALFLLLNYNQVIVGAIKQYVAPGSVVTTPVIVEPDSASMVGSDPKIIIPKIGVEAPVVYDEPKVDEASYQAALERGVVRLGNSANPGTKGNVVIGGHSSNNVFNAGKYKYVFVNLKRLNEGDIFYLNYEGQRYTYKITVAGKIISPKDTSVLAQTETPTVTLFTCDPPGTNVNRLIIQAEQIDPSPEAATANTNKQTETNQANPLPSVAPSFWDWLF